MKKNSIYVGTIKKCIDIDKYKKFGEDYLKPDYRICSMVISTKMSTVDTISKSEVLVKTSKGYIRLIDIDGLFADTRLNKERIRRVLPIEPIENGDLYVDESSLVPYYTEELEGNIKVRTLRKKVLYDCRIKGGIEH